MGDAPKTLEWEKAQFKFTVKTPEGNELKVAVIPWPRPVGVEASGATALKNPQWSSAAPDKGARFKHGDAAEMSVEAPGHDGKNVKFIVEQRVDGKWSTYQTLTGVVRNGVAVAKMQAKHPAAGQKTAAPTPHVLRFRNELLA